MNISLLDAGLIQKYTIPMSGVFFIGDLYRLFGEDNSVALFRRIRNLEEASIISRFSRGIYVTAVFNPDTLAARIIEKSYLSLGTILAKEFMIGSVPAKAIYAVRVGKNRIYEGPGLTVEYVGIAESLFFGYRADQGVRRATPEKALLDTLYFYLHGRLYSFDIYQDIDITHVNLTLIEEWLEKYQNPRFISFVKGYLHDRS
jgi:hypothetical protein